MGDLWERATFMRGMESILLDVLLNPVFVGDLLEQLTEYILETIRMVDRHREVRAYCRQR